MLLGCAHVLIKICYTELNGVESQVVKIRTCNGGQLISNRSLFSVCQVVVHRMLYLGAVTKKRGMIWVEVRQSVKGIM